MAVARKFIDKKLLHNVIRNTDAHNKIEEEKMMWRIHRVKSEQRYEDKRRKSQTNKYPCTVSNGSTHWMNELTTYESSLSDRWGHNGYKELYPEEFEEKTKDSSSDEDEDRKRRRKRKKVKKDMKDKSRISKRKRNQKTKSRSPDKKHRKRTRDSPRRGDQSQDNSTKTSTTKELRQSAPSKKPKISGQKIKEPDAKRRKTEHNNESDDNES